MAIASAGCAGNVVADPADERDAHGSCVDCETDDDPPAGPECICAYNDSACLDRCGAEAPIDARESAPASHPPPLSEAAACAALTNVYWEHALEMGCPVTIRTCPDYLRVEQGEACLLYDAASVYRCMDLWRDTQSCAALAATPCEPIAIAASAPEGCP
jgi:hypothetical protein